MSPEQQNHIKEALKTILQHLSVAVNDLSVDTEGKTQTVRFLVSTPDSALLIGQRGDRLLALNHLLKKIFEQKWGDVEAPFMVDVNDYRKKQLDDLRAKAHMLAERARYFKSSVEMDPMSSYERMIVHSEFAEVPDIQTTSQGGGKERRVVLRFVEVVV